MKKLLLLGLVSLGAIGLSGCDYINNFINSEKEYTLDQFVLLYSMKTFKHSYTTCTEENTYKYKDNEATVKSYTYVYDSSNETWKREDTGVRANLTIKDVVESYAKLYDKENMKFYASNKSYRVVVEAEERARDTRIDGETYHIDHSLTKVESKMDENGLLVSYSFQFTDYEEVYSIKNNSTYTYK